MPNMGLLGITMQDDQFFEAATEGTDVSINFDTRVLDVGGMEFQFELSQMEELHHHGDISSAFRSFGYKLFEVLWNG
jgi:hypothetical protein